MANVTVQTNRLYPGLWIHSDDQGIHPASIKQLKIEAFPAGSILIDLGDRIMIQEVTEALMERWIAELIREECIEEFVIPDNSGNEFHDYLGKKFWIIVNWPKNQNVSHPYPKYLGVRRLWQEATGRANGHAAASNGAALSADWAAAESMAIETFAGLGLDEKKQDKNLARKLCWLQLCGKIPEWVAGMAASLLKAREKGGRYNAGALLITIYRGLCKKHKPEAIQADKLLAECPDVPGCEGKWERPAEIARKKEQDDFAKMKRTAEEKPLTAEDMKAIRASLRGGKAK